METNKSEFKGFPNSKATWSAIIGVVSIFLYPVAILIGGLSIILYMIGMKEIKEKNESGHKRAYLGLLTSIFSIFLNVWFLFYYFL